MSEQEYRITINLDEATKPQLDEMRWQDRMNASEFIRWLIQQEAKRREAQPAAEAN